MACELYLNKVLKISSKMEGNFPDWCEVLWSMKKTEKEKNTKNVLKDFKAKESISLNSTE